MVGSAALTPGASVRAASGSATKPFFMEESLGHNETGRQLRKLRPVCEAGASESGRLDQRCLSQARSRYSCLRRNSASFLCSFQFVLIGVLDRAGIQTLGIDVPIDQLDKDRKSTRLNSSQ